MSDRQRPPVPQHPPTLPEGLYAWNGEKWPFRISDLQGCFSLSDHDASRPLVVSITAHFGQRLTSIQLSKTTAGFPQTSQGMGAGSGERRTLRFFFFLGRINVIFLGCIILRRGRWTVRRLCGRKSRLSR